MPLRSIALPLALMLSVAPALAQVASPTPAPAVPTEPRETIEGTLSQDRTVIAVPAFATPAVTTVAGLRTDNLGRQIADVIAADLERSGLYAPLGPGPMAQGDFINYDHVRDFLRSLPDRPHVDLLETIVDDIVDACFELRQVVACRVCVTKPDIFNEAGGAGVDVTRTRESWMKGAAR